MRLAATTTGIALSAIFLALPTPSHAQRSPGAASPNGYPYCAYQRRTGAEICAFSTMAQCRADIIGKGGYCYRNPFYRR